MVIKVIYVALGRRGFSALLSVQLRYCLNPMHDLLVIGVAMHHAEDRIIASRQGDILKLIGPYY